MIIVSDRQPAVTISLENSLAIALIRTPKARLYLAARTSALYSPTSEEWKFCRGMFLTLTTSGSIILQSAVLLLVAEISSMSLAMAGIRNPPVPPAPTTTNSI